MEKLELKHIAPYLPYRLKGYIPETIYVEDIVDGENYSYDIEPQIVEILGVTRESSFQGECIFFRGYADGYVEFEDIKIILRPLSDLTKEIDGVVGIVELAKFVDNGHNHTDSKIKRYGYSKSFSLVVSTDKCDDVHKATFSIIDNKLHAVKFDDENVTFATSQRINGWLFEHHFDVFGLIDKNLAIDINTIEL